MSLQYEIANTPLSRKAILFHLAHADSSPSHDLTHVYQVAMTAMDSAVQAGIRNRTTLQDLFIVGMFHDIIRSSQRVSDPAGVTASAEMVEQFGRENGFSTRRIRLIQQTIVKPLSTKIGQHLEFADAAYYLQENRLQAFSIENNELSTKTPKEIEAIYRKAFQHKMGKLPRAMRRRLDQLASAVAGTKTTAQVHAVKAFSRERTDPTREVIPQFFIARKERLHEFVNLLSSIAIENARPHPAFTRRIMNFLTHHSFEKYGGGDPLISQKLTQLGTLVTVKPRAKVLKNRPYQRLVRELRPHQRMGSRRQ